MIEIFKTDMKSFETTKVDKITEGTWINLIDPSEDDIKRVCSETKIERDFINYSLDFEEKARIDMEEDDGTILYIIDTPNYEIEDNSKIYATAPMGIIIVRDSYIITVSKRKNDILKEMKNRLLNGRVSKELCTFKKSRLLLELLYMNAKKFLKILTLVNKESEIAESILKKSTKNKEILHVLNLEKSLVYLTTSLKSNEIVLERTMRGNIIKLYEEDQDILEDTIIENKQAIEMSQIYSNILETTMEAYASVISNNMNDVMKILTSITIIIAVPTLVSSFWGINVPVPFQNSPYGFLIIFVFSIILAVTATLWLNKRDML